MTDLKPADLLDGRQAKRAGSRRRMLLAGLHFVQRGAFQFTANEIAERVGMHRRSVHEIFGTFADFKEELIREHGPEIHEAIHDYVANHNRSLVQVVILGK
jgi:AcrR family transcriptional regulator